MTNDVSRCSRPKRPLRHLLRLQAEGQEQVAEAIDRLAIEEFGREIDGEGGGVILELADERNLVEAGNQGNQVLNLLRLQHDCLSRDQRNKSIKVPFVTVSGARTIIFITFGAAAGSCHGSVFHGGGGPAVMWGTFAEGAGAGGGSGSMRGRG
jgi:hypothetical protein